MSKAILNKENFEEESGLNYEAFLGLTGIYGIRCFNDIEELDEGPVIITRGSLYQVIIITPEVHIEVLINRETKEIHNELMITNIAGRGYAYSRLESQIVQAKKAGYKQITLSAARGKYLDGTELFGYNFWWKFGFLMTSKSQKNFERYMKKNRRLEKDLQELCATANGREFWQKKGKGWEGTFDLSDNSPSNIIFARAMKIRKKVSY